MGFRDNEEIIRKAVDKAFDRLLSVSHPKAHFNTSKPRPNELTEKQYRTYRKLMALGISKQEALEQARK